MTDDTFDSANVNLTDLLDYLFKEENNALDIYGDCAKMKLNNQTLVNSNGGGGDLLSQLNRTLIGLEESLAQNEPSVSAKLCDKERIERFYRRKEDLFVKMKRLAEFGGQEDGYLPKCDRDATKSELNRDNQETAVDTLKSLMNELDRCESAIADCFSLHQTNKPK